MSDTHHPSQDYDRNDGIAMDLKAEELEELRAGYWDAPAEYDAPSPGGYGWAPEPYPGGGLV